MMNNEKINEKVLEITLLEAQIKELKKLIEANKDELKSELDERKVDNIDTGACKVTYTIVEKNNLDTKLAKEFIKNNANIDDFIKKSTETRFTVTLTTI